VIAPAFCNDQLGYGPPVIGRTIVPLMKQLSVFDVLSLCDFNQWENPHFPSSVNLYFMALPKSPMNIHPQIRAGGSGS
jgi:hypothetical protein